MLSRHFEKKQPFFLFILNKLLFFLCGLRLNLNCKLFQGNILSSNSLGNTADISVGSSLTFGNDYSGTNLAGNSFGRGNTNSAPVATSLNTFAAATDDGK